MTTPQPHAQTKYQVRFDWGIGGAARVAADADVIVWVDVLGAPDAADAPSLRADATVIAGGLGDAAAVADWVLQRQVDLGRRAFVAVIAAGARDGLDTRFCVEDLLGAGAVIDALAAVGLDYSSPEAAAACAAFTGLRGAVTHLATASATAQELQAAGVPAADIRAAATLVRSGAVRVISEIPTRRAQA